jgi:hypothetical protein
MARADEIEYRKKETARRRDEALKRALNTPPTPHKHKDDAKKNRKPKSGRHTVRLKKIP